MKNSFKLLAKELQNGEFSNNMESPNCTGAQCPIICQRDDGKLVVVGKKLKPKETKQFLSSNIGGIGYDEEIITIDPEMLLLAAKTFRNRSQNY